MKAFYKRKSLRVSMDSTDNDFFYGQMDGAQTVTSSMGRQIGGPTISGKPEITKGGIISVPLTTCLTGLE